MDWLKAWVIFPLLVGLAKCRRGRVTPAVPEVISLIGKGVVIPCSTPDPPTRLHESRIYWQGSYLRKNPSRDTEVMLVYNRGKLENHLQTPLYKNRTHLFRDLLQLGNFSLMIDPVKIKDDNMKVVVLYERPSQSFEQICQTVIHVTAKFQTPAVNISCTQWAGLMKVTCATQGGFPEPIVYWSLQNYSQEVARTVKPDPHSGTFSVHLTLLLNASEGQIFACFVTNPALQETVNTSVTIHNCERTGPDPVPASKVVLVAVMIALVVSVAVFISVGLRYYLTGRQNQAPGVSLATGSNAEGQELQGGDNTGQTQNQKFKTLNGRLMQSEKML